MIMIVMGKGGFRERFVSMCEVKCFFIFDLEAVCVHGILKFEMTANITMYLPSCDCCTYTFMITSWRRLS